jgi:hypothetical protein
MLFKLIKFEKLPIIYYIKYEKCRRLIYIILILVALIFLAIACNNNSKENIQSDPHFPVLKESRETTMLVSGGGELYLDDAGYLRVKRDYYSYLIIWPYGYSLKVEGGDRWVINDKNEKVARVGDWMHLVGGEIPASVVNELIKQPLPDDANGPYWLTGEVRVD